MVPKRNQRIEVWDVNDPYNPTLEGTYRPPDIGTFSYHGLQIQDGTGPYRGRVFVFVACRFIGFTDMIMQILDITDPKNIREMSRWWYPGMNTAAGEVPTWPTDGSVTVQMHDSAIYGDRAYVAWRDKGCIILDISDIHEPENGRRDQLGGWQAELSFVAGPDAQVRPRHSGQRRPDRDHHQRRRARHMSFRLHARHRRQGRDPSQGDFGVQAADKLAWQLSEGSAR
jgi:hypothetical protein